MTMLSMLCRNNSTFQQNFTDLKDNVEVKVQQMRQQADMVIDINVIFLVVCVYLVWKLYFKNYFRNFSRFFIFHNVLNQCEPHAG